MTPCVMLATPSIDGNVRVDYAISLVNTRLLLAQHGIPCRLATIKDVPFVGHARNILATLALTRPEITDLFFIDADIGWPPEKVLEFLQQPEEFLAGVYPDRRGSNDWGCALLKDAAGQPVVSRGLYQVRYAPAGFLRLKRSLLEQLATASPVYGNKNDPASLLWNFFEVGRVDRDLERLRSTDLDALSHADAIAFLRRAMGLSTDPACDAVIWGEDYRFCQRWQEIGGTCWVDPAIELTHTGTKQYVGCFADTLMAR